MSVIITSLIIFNSIISRILILCRILFLKLKGGKWFRPASMDLGPDSSLAPLQAKYKSNSNCIDQTVLKKQENDRNNPLQPMLDSSGL